MGHQYSKDRRKLKNEHISSTCNGSNDHTKKKTSMIGNYMVKSLRLDELLSINNPLNFMKHRRSSRDDMAE